MGVLPGETLPAEQTMLVIHQPGSADPGAFSLRNPDEKKFFNSVPMGDLPVETLSTGETNDCYSPD
jgi:hypothetical protein